MEDIYLRLISDDDRLTKEGLEELLTRLLSSIPGTQITMTPQPHIRGGYSVRLICPSSAFDALIAILESGGLHPCL